jgi:N-acyl-D-aspartate/D-glutamate deacylase
MCAELRDAIAAGAFGLSMSYKHLTDDRDRPMASSFADTRERIALARTVAEGGRLYVQTTLAQSDMEARYRELDELGEISRATGVTCSALAVMQQPHLPDSYRNDLAKLAELRAGGAHVLGQTMTRPLDYSFRLSKANALLYLVPVWSEIMLQTPEERKRTLSDRSLWPKLDEALRNYVPGQDIIGFFRVKIAVVPENEEYVGRSLAEIGKAEGISSCEAMLRIALADDFETLFDMTGMVHGDNDIVAELLDHELIQMGGSDAGAHVAQFAGEGDATYMLQHFVRDLGKLSLERAIQRMTGDIARDFGIKDRGAIRPGHFADLVIFDPATVERGPEILVRDLPGDGERFVRRAKGIDKVLVNGRVFVDRGDYTEARAGRTV